ncbi:endonuclease [Capsulimonas corticalis]|nr:endonuclease [Capsulimonas corticalis]
MTSKSVTLNRYKLIAEYIFMQHYKDDASSFEFERTEIDVAAETLGVKRVLNVGDLIYYFRSRQPLPDSIAATAPVGFEWIIEDAGRSRYRFRCAKISRVLPQQNLQKIKIPDATPEMVARYALGDEQALLAKLRYNRLIDIFLGITSYSLQNHLRTTVGGTQIEVDELYVGVNRTGAHYVVPVQAKGGTDKITVIQTRQDLRFCAASFPDLICRAVAAQFMSEGVIAMFELALEEDELVVLMERHFRLVPSSQISVSDLKLYRIQENE